MTTECIYIIDTFSLMFQVFHAIPPMTGTQGQPTNAVFGFTRDLMILFDRKPTHLICAFDSPGDGVRHTIYEQYKANRSEMPEDLVPQIPMLKDLLAGFRIPAIESSGWEADDIIATISTQAAERGMEVVIISSDKDLRQLLGPRVRLYNCRKNQYLDEAGLLDDWGVRPDQVVDFQSLVGDSVDNVPGVPKVGPKTAQSLIQQFGTLDEVLANADKAPGKKLRENLVEFADQARMSRELVRLRTDLELPIDWETFRVVDPDYKSLFDLFTTLGFRRYASMMREHLSETSTTPPTPAGEIRVVDTPAALTEAFARLSESTTIFADAEIDSAPLRDLKLRSLALMDEQRNAWFVPATESVDRPLLEWLAAWAGKLVIPDGKPVVHLLLNAGLTTSAQLLDLSVADYLTDAGARSHRLTDVADRHGIGELLIEGDTAAGLKRQKTMFDDDDEPQPDARLSRSYRRLQAIQQLATIMEGELADDNLTQLYDEVERPLIATLARMEHAGIFVDATELNMQSAAAGSRIDKLTAEIHELAGQSFNIDSPKQLGQVLFRDLKRPVIRKTRTGPSTDQDVLEQLAPLHPLPARIIERRQLTKLKGTYLDALPALIHPQTHRIHTTFHQTVAATGRLSGSDPNLQNIPIRTEEGRQIRRAFCCDSEELVLLCADYSQIELRVMAHFSQDSALLNAFREGRDIHAAVAAQVFDVPLEDVTSDQRRAAKAVNFGVIYGQTSYGLAASLNIENSAAAEFIDDYFSRYPGVATFCESVLRETQQTGYARTILNRRRPISGIRRLTGTHRNLAERTAINTVIQGSAADLIKLAMLKVESALAESGLQARMLLQIHDELVFEAPTHEVPALTTLVREQMTTAYPLDVPVVVDISSGPNWLDQTDLPD
ncbi:MAG: DNA polymerase I [Planctomycetaceae bacterium]|nr:DNA polymerase I [Planctomycetaceae bacterium]